MGVCKESKQLGQVWRWLLRRQNSSTTEEGEAGAHACEYHLCVSVFARVCMPTPLLSCALGDRRCGSIKSLPFWVQLSHVLTAKPVIVQVSRRTSGDMSVFMSGESAIDAVLSAEGGKML